jgi:hypothetical protein
MEAEGAWMSTSEDQAEGLQPDPPTQVEALTAAKVRTFLFEVAEGVSNYRSLHSLTEQVEHQYHGRFLIELIQNAHDALHEQPAADQAARIAILLDPQDSPHGTLLVANDGLPFNRSNFERLSQLGQSDKDPQKSIGNKGLGFRSVLEVSDRPEIYSRASPDSAHFDGYCFAFESEVVQALKAPMLALAAGGPVPDSPVTGRPIVDWAEALLSKFRIRVQAEGAGWLAAETRFLSPYLLPVPRRQVGSPAVKALEARGFMSVVRLPLKSEAAAKLVRDHMAQLSPTTLLFLERVRALELTGAEPVDRVISRDASLGAGVLAHRTVRLSNGGDDTRSYEVWTRQIHIADTTEEFRAAVKALPGRWPEIEDVSVSVAVRVAEVPEEGVFSIYMPTGIPTGSAVHVNAPFFGNMSRTDISFNDGYNRRLLNAAASLVVEVVRKQLAGKGLDEARMIVDMLAPFSADAAASVRWVQLVEMAFQRAKAAVDDEALALAEHGWRKLGATALLPETSRTRLINEHLLRKHATFDIFDPGLTSRRAQIEALANARAPHRGANATVHQVAATVARIAEEVHREEGDWNAFWHDVALLMPNGQEVLARHPVILGNDGRLHAASGTERVYFVPRQGTDDDSDIGSEGAPIDVPTNLQSTVAFLHESITVYEPDSRPARQTPVRRYLAAGLVTQFRVEAIFTGTLKDATPELPAKLKGPEAERCLAILRWALSMIRSAVARERGSDAVMALLRPIPVPCRGGWYAMSEGSFGEGWSATTGDLLASYLSAVPSSAAKHARSSLLLPPDDSAWDGLGATAQDLLRRGGVFDGLRLQAVRSDAWQSQFHASVHSFELPPSTPPGFDAGFWADYKRHVESTVRGGFQGLQPYVVGTLLHFPGMADHPLGDVAREALSELILKSLPWWGDGLEPVMFSKRGGQADRRAGNSPLKHFLQTRAWLAVPGERNTIQWSRPSERWHVPAHAVSRRLTHFAHLCALPYSLARRLDTNPELASRVHQMGMRYLDLDAETNDPALLSELIAAIGSETAPEPNILLGQIRDAWHRFRPQADQQGLAYLPVRTRGTPLQRHAMTEGTVVYLPDLGTLASELEQFGVSVLTLYPQDATALRDWFRSAYGERVVPTSELRLVPRVDDAAWDGNSAELLSESNLAWLIAPLLTLIAFYQQIRGIHAPAFRERLDRLREMRVDWVERIELVVRSGDVEVMRTEVPAHWDLNHKTLLVSAPARRQPAKIATALAQSIDRDDLELPLRVLLGPQSSSDDPPTNLAEVLATFKVSVEQLDTVQQHLRGDVGHAARLLQVMCEVLSPTCDHERLLSADTDEGLIAAVSVITPPDVSTREVVQWASASRDAFEFGSTLSKKLGERFELPSWNAALIRLGRAPLENHEWQQQLRAHLEESRGLANRIAAHLLRAPQCLSYKEMLGRYEALVAGNPTMGREQWEIDYPTAMGLVAEMVQNWPGGCMVAGALKDTQSAATLRSDLEVLGVDVAEDPDERYRANHQTLTAVCERLDRLRQAWWVKTATAADLGDWQSLRDDLIRQGMESIGDQAYSSLLTEADVFENLRQMAAALRTPALFFASVQSTASLAAIQSTLGISDQDLIAVDSRLAAMRDEATRRRQVVQVCGEDFDASDDNRTLLWHFLHERIEFQKLATDAPLDLGRSAELMPADAGRTREPKENSNPKPTKPPQRQPKAVDELIGLAGEIYVFEMLRQRYGKDVVTASSWISSNSRQVFPDNPCDDGAGCDFAFSAGGRSYKVEVKASAGDEPAFKLGSSEIALAMALASQKRGRRVRFLLVHVRNALSTAPDAVVLPNPYASDSVNVFRIDQADARVTYREKR